MSLFYLGLNPRYNWYSWLPDGINVMYSAGGFWDGRGWRRRNWVPGTGGKWLDSGGYTLLNKHGDYPFTHYAYLNLVSILRPDFYAALDYPCEPDISRRLGVMTNQQRIKQTVENSYRLVQDSEMVGSGQPVPVIQGYSLKEYKHCIDAHDKRGSIMPYMAVGSMCRRMSNKKLQRLVMGIHDHAAQAGIERLHYFGLKLSPVLNDLAHYIYSRDSAAVFFDYTAGSHHSLKGRRVYAKGKKDKKKALLKFLDRVEELNLQYK